MTAPATPAVIRGARRVAIVAIVLSLVVAAALGILALLSREFGETQGKIMLTTLVIAAFSITALCHLAIAARTLRWLGYVGIVASAAAVVPPLVLIWASPDHVDENPWLKALGVLTTLAVSLAHANLLLLLATRRDTAVRIGLGLTVLAIAAVAVMFWIVILSDGRIPGENEDYWRALGVIGILDVLGTIALPVLGLVRRDRDAATTRLTLDLPDDVGERLATAAQASGTTVEAEALAALQRGLPESPGQPSEVTENGSDRAPEPHE